MYYLNWEVAMLEGVISRNTTKAIAPILTFQVFLLHNILPKQLAAFRRIKFQNVVQVYKIMQSWQGQGK